MRKMCYIIIFVVATMLACRSTPPEKLSARVNDYAGMMSPNMREELEQLLYDHEKATTDQIVIATFVSLEGESLEDASLRLANKWKIGQKGKDNGVLIIAFRDDREIRIEVGYGFESVLTDAVCKSIMDSVIIPKFKSGDFDGGFKAGVEALIEVIEGK